MRLRSKKLKGLVVILLIFLAAGSGYWYLHRNTRSENAAAVTAQRAVPVQRRSIAQTVSSSGKIKANKDLQLAFDVGGKIKRILVTKGQQVRAGDVLAELENENQRLAYLNAVRQYELAKLESPPSVVQENEISVQLARKELEATSLKAPYDGIIVDLLVEEGEWVTTGEPVARLIDPSKYFIELNVDEVDIRFVQINQPVTVTLDAYPDLAISGTVVDIDFVPQAQGDLVLFPVLVELDEADPRIRAGMSAEARITIARAERALVVPLEAVVETNGNSMVTVVTPEGPQPRPVRTGISDGVFVEVVEGLKDNDRVLASNYEMYRTLFGAGVNNPGNTGNSGFRMQMPGQAGGIRR